MCNQFQEIRKPKKKSVDVEAEQWSVESEVKGYKLKVKERK